jgi:hypothetical protein
MVKLLRWKEAKIAQNNPRLFAKRKLFSMFACPLQPGTGLPQCLGGGIGRRVGLKHQWPQGRAGSTPAQGTENPV